MGRILFAWELGDGLGHVGRLLPIAKALRQGGHDCIFALRHLGPAARVVSAEGFDVVQAPFAAPAAPEKPIGSLGDILATIGYGSVERLEPLVNGWDALIQLLAIDLVVADYSPTACLAARGQTPVVAVGDGFTLPPASGPIFPPFKAGGLASVDEAVLLNCVRRVQEKRRRPGLEALPRIFAEAKRFIVTLPELYPTVSTEEGLSIVGPLSPLPVPADEPPVYDYFAYLSTGAKGVWTALESLASSSLQGQVFLRDASADHLARARTMGLQVFDAPQRLAMKAASARVLIHHGGLGTSEVGLAVGRPQLLVPRHQEQALNAAFLRHLGVAVSMVSGGRYNKSHMDHALTHVISSRRFTEAATQRARLISSRAPDASLERVCSACTISLKATGQSNAAGIPSSNAKRGRRS